MDKGCLPTVTLCECPHNTSPAPWMPWTGCRPPRGVLEWPCTAGGGGATPPPTPQTKGTIVGDNEIYRWGNLIGPLRPADSRWRFGDASLRCHFQPLFGVQLTLVYAVNNSLIHWCDPWSSLELTEFLPPTPEYADVDFNVPARWGRETQT